MTSLRSYWVRFLQLLGVLSLKFYRLAMPEKRSCTKPLRGSFLAAICCPFLSCDVLSSPWMDY
jgi:hypothetical protein